MPKPFYNNLVSPSPILYTQSCEIHVFLNYDEFRNPLCLSMGFFSILIKIF